MNANDYQKAAHEFASYDEGREETWSNEYPHQLLCEEAGEVNGKRAKFLRHHHMTPEMASNWVTKQEDYKSYVESQKGELGDTLWAIAEIATRLGLTLDEIMEYNIEKLTDRKSKGVIDGSGDTTAERIANASKSE